MSPFLFLEESTYKIKGRITMNQSLEVQFGTMARLPEIMAFAENHKMVVLTIEDIVRYRLQ